MRFSFSVVWPSVLSLNIFSRSLKYTKQKQSNTFAYKKNNTSVNFYNPGLPFSEQPGQQGHACSDILFCARSRTSGSSLVFPSSTLARAILLHAATSSFKIQLGGSQFHRQTLSSSFRNFHWTSERFHGPQYRRIPLDCKPLPAFRSVFEKYLN